MPGGGSIIRTAAFCGLVGLKPSHDWIACRNARDFAPSFDVAGLLTRDVADLQLAMHALTGRAGYDPDGPLPRHPVVGVARIADCAKAPDYVHEACERTAARLARAGLAIREIDLPADYDLLSDAQHVIVQYETARLFDWELGAARERLDSGVKLQATSRNSRPQPCTRFGSTPASLRLLHTAVETVS